MRNAAKVIRMSEDLISQYRVWLEENEKSRRTVEKYCHYAEQFRIFTGECILTKKLVIRWKENLKEHFSPGTVNGALAAVNGLFRFCGREDLKVRFLKVDRPIFYSSSRELTKQEYVRLVKAARREGNERLALLLQTVCSTGIRISELTDITVEAVKSRSAQVECKGRIRTVFLPATLCRLLADYAQRQGIRTGQIFVSRKGRPLDRSNIWRDMKKLGKIAGVSEEKIFPHNLRHLFARQFYGQEKDLLRLSDILGHSDINTTRIYTAESGYSHIRQLDNMGLVVERYNGIALLL